MHCSQIPSLSRIRHYLGAQKGTHQAERIVSSIRPYSEGKTVRSWLKGQSFAKQREFGLKVLREHGLIE